MIRRVMVVLLVLILFSPSGCVRPTNQAVVELVRAGHYDEALPLAQRTLVLAEQDLGPRHPTVVTAHNNLGMLYLKRGEYSKAEPHLRLALEIKEQNLGPDHPEMAASLTNLAELYREMKEFGKAEALHKRVVELTEKGRGQDHLEVATALASMALTYKWNRDYGKAEPLYRRALAIRERALGPAHPDVAEVLADLGMVYADEGSAVKALPLFERAYGIWKRQMDADQSDAILSTQASLARDMAAQYLIAGQYAKAETLYREALTFFEKSLGPDHIHVALLKDDLAEVYKSAGEYGKAEPLLRQSLQIREKEDQGTSGALPVYRRNLVNALTKLGELHRILGDYNEAESMYKRALAVNEDSLGPHAPERGSALTGLALLYAAIGDYGKAGPLLEQARGVYEKSLGPNHPAVAITRLSQADMARVLGEYAKAEGLSQQALANMEQSMGPDHPMVATALNNFGVLYDAMEAYEKERPLHERALTIREKSLGPDHVDVATSLGNLAELSRRTGDYARAIPLNQRSLGIYEKTLGPFHPMVVTTLQNRAFLEAAQQDYRSAFATFKKVMAIEGNLIHNVFAFTTEDQKLKFIQSLSGTYDAGLSLLVQYLQTDQEAVREGLRFALSRKGAVFDAQSRVREGMEGRLSSPVRKEWERLSVLRSELARLLLHKPEKMRADEYKTKLVSLQQQIEESERRVATESALVAKELQQRTLTIERVAKQLPKNTALAEFVKIRDVDFATGKWKPSWRYLAFVLTSASDVTLVDLGEASALEALAQRVLTDIKVSMATRGIQIVQNPRARDPIQQSLLSLQSLYAQLWAPLEKPLGNVDKVVLSPDGLLNLVPFAALRNGQDRSLVERYQVAYVSSGRELVGVEGALPRPGSDLLLLANPSFDQKGADAGHQGTAFRSREFRGVFTPLPGTERESREIPPLVAAPKERKQVLVGERATETAVKAARSPRILHLATHGFFLVGDEGVWDAMEFGGVPDRGITVVARPTAKRYENPLVRSGLAFAGANQAATITDGDDGILTALEITGMDLYGTELVVLSACDTGVGEVKTGEGVFGLRRAFALAGAKNLLISLWEVSDEVTARQMKAFYQNLQKLPPAQALRQAQLETIKELKAEYGGLAPPGLWAPFILQGAQALGQ